MNGFDRHLTKSSTFESTSPPKEPMNLNEKTLECGCGIMLSPRDLEKHAIKCTIFKRRYEKFFKLTGKILDEYSDMEELKVIDVLLNFFQRRIKEKMKPEKSIEPPKEKKDEKKAHHNGDTDVIMKPVVREEIKEEVKEIKEFYSDFQDSNMVRCVNCKAGFLELDAVVYLDECLHVLCRSCLKILFQEQFPDKQTVQCPEKGCTYKMKEFELKQLLGPEEFQRIEKLSLSKYLTNSVNMVECQCGNMIEVVPGQVNLSQKDDKGEPITEAAAVHMSKHRVRCRECNHIFCAKCKVAPYHIGKTCEQFEHHKGAKTCRYCNDEIVGAGASSKPAFQNVCKKAECIKLMSETCDKILKCGHPCNGFSKESRCLPCLNPECVAKDGAKTLDQDADAFCMICYTSGLGEMPCIQLECGHIFHLDCIATKIKKRFPGPRITFFFCECPACKKWIKADHHPMITEEMKKTKALYDEIKSKAIQRSKFEGLDKHERLNNPTDPYYKNLEKYAFDRLSYYSCFDCKQPYFGGLKACENINEQAGEYKPQDLVCGKCASAKGNIPGSLDCAVHGKDFIEFKCRFCCAVAQWFCWGNTHFCDPCHTKQQKGDYLSRKQKSELPKCSGPKECALKIDHPPNGDEFSLGCAVCRNSKANFKEF